MYSSLLSTQSTTVKSRQISNSNIPVHGFLSKCKNSLILLTDQFKSQKKKNDKNIELELFLVQNICCGYSEEPSQ